MAHTKVISFRIPWELHEEILKEAVVHNLSTSEYIILQLTLVKDLDSNLDNIIKDVVNCGHSDCPLAYKFSTLQKACNLDLE